MTPRALSALLVAACCVQVASAASVFAHFMMANSYAYDIEQWKTDITAAQQIGIDGFALNWTPPDCSYPSLGWVVDRIDDAFTAAESMGFKLMHSFDMSWTECSVYWNQTFMADMITKHSGSSATYRWNTNILVSTYGGDSVEQYGNTFFQGLKDNLKNAGNPISLVPALITYSSEAQSQPTAEAAKLVSDYPSIDGFFNWQAWPLNTDSNLTSTPDEAFQSALKKAGRTGPYMMAVSPWQYKDLNDGNSADAWVSYSDTLFHQRLHDVASSTFQPDIIELLTWNDFCESHYLRDLPSQSETATDYVVYTSGMNNYVEGMNHAPWRIIAKYFISWWKNGEPPATTMDQVVYWYRVHPKNAVCLGGSSTGIRNYEYPVDAVFAWALTKSNATVSVSMDGGKTAQTFNSDNSGPSLSMIPFPSFEGSITPEVKIVRNGNVIANSTGSQPITTDCAWQNFNAVVNLCGEGVNGGPLN